MANNEILDDGLDAFLNELKDVKPIKPIDTVLTVHQKKHLGTTIKKTGNRGQSTPYQ